MIVLTRPLKEIPGDHIHPTHVVLLLEVSDSTLRLDLATKAGLYARAKALEYWVLDVNGPRLVVHRDPQEGKYNSIVSYSSNEQVSPLAAPEKFISVAELLG